MALKIPNEDRIMNYWDYAGGQPPEEFDPNDPSQVNADWIMNMLDKIVNGNYATKSFNVVQSMAELPENAEQGQTAYVIDTDYLSTFFIYDGMSWINPLSTKQDLLIFNEDDNGKVLTVENDKLIWTEKNNLYDIKLLSQAIVDKGFSFMCKTIRQDLTKSQVPTLYNDILQRYNDCDKEVDSVTRNVNNTYSVMQVKKNKFTGEFFGYIDSGYYRSSTKDFSSKTPINLQHDGNFYLGKNINIVMFGQYRNIDVYNENWEYIKTLNIDKYNWNYTQNVRASYENNKFIFGLGSISGGGHVYDTKSRYYKLYVEDTLQADFNFEIIYDEILLVSATETISGHNYTTTYNPRVIMTEPRFVKDNIGVSSDTDRYYLTKCNYREPQINYNSLIFYVDKNAVYQIQSDEDYSAIIKSYGLKPTSNPGYITNVINGYFYAEIRVDDNIKLYKINANLEDVVVPLTYYGYGSVNLTCGKSIEIIENYDVNTYGHVLMLLSDNILMTSKGVYSIDEDNNFNSLITFTNVIENLNNVYYAEIENNEIMLSFGNDFYYADTQPKVYTDTYNINGSNIDIDYYKTNDFKICIKDNGTNDNNLEAVFNYLGYLNYWLLDYNNETISILRDKNTYSLMFVGDNFEDTLNNLPAKNYSGIAQRNELQDVIDSTNTTDTLTINNYTRYIYTQELTSLTINLTTVKKAEVLFTSSSSATLTLASGQKYIGSTTLIDNTNYILTINNGIIRIEQIDIA